MTYDLGRLTSTPQTEPIPGSGQVENSAGGFVWEVDDWTRLTRFLILGADGPTYYASAADHGHDNLLAVERCLKLDGERTVSIIVDVSTSGRAPKQGPAIAALACAASLGDLATKRAAWEALSQVCRTATHLFEFIGYAQKLRGWGRGLRVAVAHWYDDRQVEAVAYQATKYRERLGFTHRDALRLAHPTAHSGLYRWITSGDASEAPEPVYAFERLQQATSPNDAASVILSYPDLTREMVPTGYLTSPEVWAALLLNMPTTAMIRNLATMTRIGLISPGSAAEAVVVERLADADRIQKARIHPIAVLAALQTYACGRSARGSTTWFPTARVVDALDGAFYLAFGNLPKTGKRRLLALDVSGSMTWGEVAGIPGLTPAVASAAMALTSAASGDPYQVVAFGTSLTPVNLSPRQRLDDVCRTLKGISMGGTDCALPMTFALARGWEFDTFEVYTDNETWAGPVHPAQALRQYRQKTGIDARLAVVAMVSNGFSIADPSDPGMLDVVGFDTSTPELLAGFAAGTI